MTTTVVDLAGLADLADRLAAAGEQLCSAGRALEPTAAAAGVPGLADAIDAFCDTWRRGLQRTGEAAQVAGTQLRDAEAAYAQVECAISRACA